MRQVNIGEQCRNAFLHAFAWWISLAKAAGHPVPPDLNLAKVLRSSQLLRNMVAWFSSHKCGMTAVLNFYSADRRVNSDRISPFVALMFVSTQVAGMPNWMLSGLEAGDMDRNIEQMVTGCPRARGELRDNLAVGAGKAAADVLAAMRNLQDSGTEVTEYFRNVPLRETDLLSGLRTVTAISTRLMCADSDMAATQVRAALAAFRACEPETDLDEERYDPMRRAVSALAGQIAEPVATHLAEQIAEQMSTVEERFERLDQKMADVAAAAFGAEQIADAAEKKVDDAVAAVKASAKASPPKTPDALTRRVAALAERADEAHRAVDALRAEHSARLVRLEARIQRVTELEATLARLTGRLDALELAPRTPRPVRVTFDSDADQAPAAPKVKVEPAAAVATAVPPPPPPPPEPSPIVKAKLVALDAAVADLRDKTAWLADIASVSFHGAMISAHMQFYACNGAGALERNPYREKFQSYHTDCQGGYQGGYQTGYEPAATESE